MAIPYAPSQSYIPDSSIIQLIQQAGRDAANGQRASGQIWGNVLGNLGQIASGTIRDIAENKRQAPIDAQNAQLRQQAITRGQNQLDAEQEKSRLNDVMSNQQQMTAQGQDMTPESIASNLSANGLGQYVPEVLKAHQETRAALAAQRESTAFTIANFADHAAKFVGTPVFDGVLAQSAKDLQGIVPGVDQTIAEIRQLPPDQQRLKLESLAAMSPTYNDRKAKAAKENTVVAPETSNIYTIGPDGKPVLSVAATPKPETRSVDDQIAEAMLKNDAPRVATLLKAKKASAEAGRVADPTDTGLSLTTPALDMAAQRYLIDGSLPPMGMGKAGAGVRQRILNRAAEIDPTANVAGNKASYQADSGSLKTLQMQYDAVNAFESTANKNSAALKTVLDKIPDVGVKFLNAPLRMVASQFGSENMAKINILRQSLQNEYGRIISNPTLKGVMTDAARKEGEALLDPNLTLGQLKTALDTFALEAGNRKSSYGEELKTIQGRITGKKSEAQSPAQLPSQASSKDPLGLR